MKIAVDLRSLQSGTISGVENYTQNLLEHLLVLDKKNYYTLFYNSVNQLTVPEFNFINSKTVQRKIPNKILNPALKLKLLNMEKLAGGFDWFFMPNLNQVNLTAASKLAITVHDLSPIVVSEYYDLKRKFWHHFLNLNKIFTRANLIFAVSEWTKQDLMRLFKISEQKIKVIYPGIDRNHFTDTQNFENLRRVRNSYGLPGEYLLFLNTVEPRKNLVGLIKAFERLAWPGWLVISGKKGWKYKEIFKIIEQSSKSDKIKYIGYVKESDKPALIKLAQALVYPSFYEGFGFQPLEAAACGVPVIASQVSALPEVAGQFALLVNPYDQNSLILGLQNILNNLPLRESLISKGLSEVEKFSWQHTAKEVLVNIENF